MDFKNWFLTEDMVDVLDQLLQLRQSPQYNYRKFWDALRDAETELSSYIRMGRIKDRDLLVPISFALENDPETLPQVIQKAILKLQSQPKPRSVFDDDEE